MDNENTPVVKQAPFELNKVQKKLIKRYINKVITPTGIILIALSLFFGLIINFSAKEIAQEKALTKAIEKTYSLVLPIIQEASKAGEKAKEILVETEKLKNDATNLWKEAKVLKNELKTDIAFRESKDIVKAVSDNLHGRPDFIKSVSGKINNRVSALEGTINELGGNTCAWSPWTSKAHLNLPMICAKKNEYLKGVEFRHGMHVDWWQEEIRIQCCELK